MTPQGTPQAKALTTKVILAACGVALVNTPQGSPQAS